MAITVTAQEQKAITAVESLYCALQTATEKVVTTLQFQAFMAPQSSSIFQRFLQNFRKKQQKFANEQELYELLEALTILKGVFEVNMPLVIEGRLYFKFQGLEKGGNIAYEIGASHDRDDLPAYFTDVKSRMADALELPEIARAMHSPLLAHYCPALARTKMKFSDSYQELKCQATSSSLIGDGE